MRKYLSVLALEVRSSFYKIMLILAGMGMVQVLDFKRVLKELTEEVEARGVALKESEFLPFTLERVLEESHVQLIFLAALFGMMIILLWSGSQKGKIKSKETLWRLSVSPDKIFAIWSVYHLLCYVMLILAQILMVIALHARYQQLVDTGNMPQALFLAFVRNDFLHSLLPMWDPVKCIRIICVLLVWAAGTVYLGYVIFDRHYYRFSLVLGYLVLSGILTAFGEETRGWDIIFILLSLLYLISILVSVRGGWGYEMGET